MRTNDFAAVRVQLPRHSISLPLLQLRTRGRLMEKFAAVPYIITKLLRRHPFYQLDDSLKAGERIRIVRTGKVFFLIFTASFTGCVNDRATPF